MSYTLESILSLKMDPFLQFSYDIFLKNKRFKRYNPAVYLLEQSRSVSFFLVVAAQKLGHMLLQMGSISHVFE